MATDDEETLTKEFRALFKRIRDLGYREGEQAALSRVINLAQSALADAQPGSPAESAPGESSDPPTLAQRRDPLRPVS